MTIDPPTRENVFIQLREDVAALSANLLGGSMSPQAYIQYIGLAVDRAESALELGESVQAGDAS